MNKRYSILMTLALATVTGVQANPITRAEARLVAQQLVGISDNTPDGDAIEPFYVFSRGQGRGFVIVSGDDSTAPILGYTEQGDYQRGSMPEPLEQMLDAWDSKLRQVQQLHREAPRQLRAAASRALPTYKKDWDDVPALVQTHWHQSSPYNDLAPVKEGKGRCMTGCVATAGSQVTYYFHRDNPTELQYDTPTYSYGTPITVSLPKGTPIEWNLMRLSGSGSAAQNNAVATLMYALGTSAWLTYGDGDGTATSGHNYKMADAMRGQFHLNSSHAEKSGYSQENWEKLIYSNLKSRRPMLYSGVHPTSGGHSVVLDGYQHSTGLFHFNFGWGGQSDGWYTVDDATGMNGFNSYQDLIYDITPQVQNLEGSIAAATIYHKAPSNITVRVKNKGTLDYSGVYLYTSTQPRLPSQATGVDAKTVITTDEEVELTFSVAPALNKPLYLFLCGKNKQLLDSCLMEVQSTVADLHLKSISVNAGTESVSVDGMQFQIVNDTASVFVSANLTNAEQGTYCQPSFQCYLDSYDTATGEWTRVKSIIQRDMTFLPQQTQDAVFDFTSLRSGVLYRAYLNNVAVASEQTPLVSDVSDSIVYFTPRQSDLKVTVSGRTATIAGHWNEHQFLQQANDPAICAYFIDELTDIDRVPAMPNPNALFYTTNVAHPLAGQTNVVADAHCQNLIVQTGADFRAVQPFKADKATFVLADAVPAKWQGALVPFAADVPFGMQVKVPESSTSTIIRHNAALHVEAMTPVTYLTSRSNLRELVSYDVSVVDTTTVNLFDGKLNASTLALPLEDTWLVLGDYLSSLYFVPAEEATELPAFHQYVVSSTGLRVRTTGETKADGYYKILAQWIGQAYQAMTDYPEASEDSRSALMQVLQLSEEFFTYRKAAQDDEIKVQYDQLSQAVADFISGAKTGIVAPEVSVAMPTPEGTVYYNLSGQRIDRPATGLVIVRQGRTVRKVLIK